MMSLRGAVLLAGVAAVLSQAPDLASAQGKGGGKGQGGGPPQGVGQGKSQGVGKGQGQGKAQSPGKSRSDAAGGRGRSDVSNRGAKGRGTPDVMPAVNRGKAAQHRFMRPASLSSVPSSVRRFAANGRAPGLILAAAVSHAYARGHGSDFRIDQAGNRMLIANRNGDPLVYLDDESARNLGRWRVDVVDDDVREGAPAFCRSGAGHPVWGREWCLDKGFGLGSYEDYRWGRTNDIGNIVFPTGGFRNSLASSVLASLLGTSTFNRLALHAVTLGLLEPLTGRWVSEPTGPQLLMVNSGSYPLAEFVDLNRDNRADDLLVALRPW